MKKIYFDVVGAYDRFNYGDMLFPYIVEFVIKKYFDEYNVEFYSMRNSDFSKYGAKKTRTIAEMNNNDHYVIIAGGDTMVANIQFMYLDNISNKILFLIERCIRKIIGENYIKLVMKRTGVTNEYPYVVNNNKALYNAVGGCGLKDIKDKEKIINTLKEALYIGVRDIATFNELNELGAKLVPDSAIILSDIWTKEILDNQFQHKYTELKDKYVVIQLSGKFGNTKLLLLEKIILNMYENRKVKTVLLPLGRATSHGDTRSLLKLNRKTKEFSYYYDNITLKEITWILANSIGFIGTSLHGNIITLSYGKSSILIAKEGSKNWWYWRTWLEKSNCILSTFEDMEINTNKLDQMTNYDTVANQKVNVYNHFTNMIQYIKNDINK